MKLLGFFVALFIALMGLIGLFAPDLLMAIGQYSVTPVGLYVAATLRIGIGLVLVGVARASRAPRTLRILGVIAITAGVTTLFLGTGRAQAILEWWFAQGTACIRLWAGFALLLGSFIAFAVTPRRPGV